MAAREHTDRHRLIGPNGGGIPWHAVEATSERVGHLRVLVGLLVGIFVAGATCALYVSRLATKEELQQSMAAHVIVDETHHKADEDRGTANHDELVRLSVGADWTVRTVEQIARKMNIQPAAVPAALKEKR